LPLDGIALAASLAAVARETIVDGCLGETVAALEAARALEQASAPPVCDALRIIARDEASHAELAFRILRWALAEGDESVRRVVAATLAELAEYAAPRSPREAPRASSRGSGILSARELADVRARAVRDVVRPCLEGLLAA
jgi:hypothetical protein